MSDAIERLRQHAINCRRLAQTALTENGREVLNGMAEDYDLRAERLRLKSSRPMEVTLTASLAQ